MKTIRTDIEEVIVIEPDCFCDERGYFMETYHEQKYAALGIDVKFVQDNHSRSSNGVLRGLHYQQVQPQDKLIWVDRGEIFDVAVDLRLGSKTFGKWTSAILSDSNHRQIFIPKGFAHGFVVLSELADVTYKCSDLYCPTSQLGIIWNDPSIAIDWPVRNVTVSEKDAKLPTLSTVDKSLLPKHN